MTLIVIDLETTGLKEDDYPIEVAAVVLDSDLNDLVFVPYASSFDPLKDGAALRINRYFERGCHERMLSKEETATAYRELHDLLKGATLGGSNPRFDAAKLVKVFRYLGFEPKEPWHHRLADVSAYAAGAMGLPPDKAPGLQKLCEILDIQNDHEHSALGDARATAACFRRLIDGGIMNEAQ
jgi:DNA polymerase-3 subunit epsilon